MTDKEHLSKTIEQGSNNPSLQVEAGNKGKKPFPHFNVSFPYARQPDIIRANQKDVYYQRVLEEQMTNVFRQFFGTRSQHYYQKEVVLLSDLFYFCLTTLVGTQTLGEEYCDILQVSESTKKFPNFQRRATQIFWHAIFPYFYTRGTAEIRKRTKPSWREQFQVETGGDTKYKTRFREFLHKYLPKIQLFFTNHIHPFHLAIFYFFGAYYGFSKRLTGIRYIFTRQLSPNEQHFGYEVLGFLLLIQLIIQTYQYQKQLSNGNEDKNDIEEDFEAEEDQADFLFTSSMGLTPQEINARKCTLCLSPRINTTATGCGHLFCWSCIAEWCRNKPECPLCRQHINLAHLLPIYNY
ncbi:hypothetical protein G9A89_017934 [Geosiphon pyriformis]|nr:hypothetical protein G9A89_017934 [Geosiphon pyriformis]